MDTVNLNKERLKFLLAELDRVKAIPLEKMTPDDFAKCQKLLKDIEATVKKIKLEEARAAVTEEDRAEAEADATALMTKLITDFRIHFTAASGEWWWHENGEWFSGKPQDFMEKFRGFIGEDDAYGLFQSKMDEMKRKLNLAHYAWVEQAGYLNLLDMGGFCPPVEAKSYHPIFDLLFFSVGGGKQENIDYLEKWFLAKYLHPENYMLPALCLGDNGGTGKSVMSSLFGGTLFGGRKNVLDNATMEQVFGKFNSGITGKALVLVNEAPDYDDDKGINRIICSPSFMSKAEHKVPVHAVNTAAYIICTNPKTGGYTIRLAHSDVDRRFSVMFGAKPLKWLIAEYFKLSHDDDDEAGDLKMKQELQNILKDPIEVGKWVWCMVEKWGDVHYLPALHGDDYKVQRENTVDLVTRVCLAIFTKEFSHIRGEVLFEFAKAKGCSNKQPSFYNAVAAWCKEYRPNITRVKGKAWYDKDNAKRTNALVFVKDNDKTPTTLTANDDDYGELEYGRWTKWFIDIG